MRFDHMLISFLLLAAVIAGAAMMISSMNDESIDVNISDERYSGIYDKVDDIYNISEGAKSSTLDQEISGGTESWESMTKGSYSSIRLMQGAFPLFSEIVNVIGAELGIPPLFLGIAWVAFLITIIFGLVYMVFRYLPNS